MNSKALQNPSDLDATYRNNAEKQLRGFAANLEDQTFKHNVLTPA